MIVLRLFSFRVPEFASPQPLPFVIGVVFNTFFRSSKNMRIFAIGALVDVSAIWGVLCEEPYNIHWYVLRTIRCPRERNCDPFSHHIYIYISQLKWFLWNFLYCLLFSWTISNVSVSDKLIQITILEFLQLVHTIFTVFLHKSDIYIWRALALSYVISKLDLVHLDLLWNCNRILDLAWPWHLPEVIFLLEVAILESKLESVFYSQLKAYFLTLPTQWIST